jgi:ketopantoate reductase
MADAGPQDVVLLTVKAHQVVDLLPDLRDLFGPQTLVVTMINGIPWWYFRKLAGPTTKAAGSTRSTRAAACRPRQYRARTRHRQRGLPGGRTGGAGRGEA